MKKDNITQFLKFVVVGVSNTAVDWLAYFILTGFVITDFSAKPLAKAIAFLVAVTNSYIWNTIWTFRKEYQKTTKGGQTGAKGVIFIKFVLVGLVGWGINYLVFKMTLNSTPDTHFELMGKTVNMRDVIALVFASGAAVLWNFFANKLWTYRK